MSDVASFSCDSMALAHLHGVTDLCAELGYPAVEAQVTRRFHALLSRVDNGLFVATHGSDVFGWAHVYGVRLLETEGYAEIGGIVVRTQSRKHGIGKALLRRCEAWAAEHCYDQVRLRSGLHRDEAHQFYETVGYERSKASFMFKRATGYSAGGKP